MRSKLYGQGKLEELRRIINNDAVPQLQHKMRNPTHETKGGSAGEDLRVSMRVGVRHERADLPNEKSRAAEVLQRGRSVEEGGGRSKIDSTAGSGWKAALVANFHVVTAYYRFTPEEVEEAKSIARKDPQGALKAFEYSAHWITEQRRKFPWIS